MHPPMAARGTSRKRPGPPDAAGADTGSPTAAPDSVRLAVLRGAARRLATRPDGTPRWLQGSEARNAAGRRVPWNSPTARRICLHTALRRAAAETASRERRRPAEHPAGRWARGYADGTPIPGSAALYHVVEKRCTRRFLWQGDRLRFDPAHPEQLLTCWGDEPGRTATEVIGAIEETIRWIERVAADAEAKS